MEIAILGHIDGKTISKTVEARLFKQSATTTPLFLHRAIYNRHGTWEYEGWAISDAYTGLQVCHGDTREDCKKAFEKVAQDKEKVETMNNIRGTRRSLEESLVVNARREALKEEWKEITGFDVPIDRWGLVNTFDIERMLGEVEGKSLRELITEHWGKRASMIISHLLSKSKKYAEYYVKKVDNRTLVKRI